MGLNPIRYFFLSPSDKNPEFVLLKSPKIEKNLWVILNPQIEENHILKYRLWDLNERYPESKSNMFWISNL